MKKLLALYAWVKTPKGRARLHGIVTALLALYTALHRAGA